MKKPNASQSADRIAHAKLTMPTYQFMLFAFGKESSLKDKFNDNGKAITLFGLLASTSGFYQQFLSFKIVSQDSLHVSKWSAQPRCSYVHRCCGLFIVGSAERNSAH